MSTPDFILINGTVWTGDDNNSLVEAFASGHGKITSIGTTKEILANKGKNTIVYDAQSNLIVPGFTDSHVHFLTGGLSLMEVNLSGVCSRKEFEERISRQHSKLEKNEWMCGSGWDDTKINRSDINSKTGLPDSSWIDSVCSDRPVYLAKYDMHTALVNKKALEFANITSSTENPFGGEIVRDPVSGEPTGILKDTAMKLVEEKIPPSSRQTQTKALFAACEDAARNGVTAVHDMTPFEDLEIVAEAARNDDFTVRFRTFQPIKFMDKIIEEQQKYSDPRLQERFRIAGVKAFSDGSLGSHTAYFYDEYSDTPGNFGLPNDIFLPEGNLNKILIDADAKGLQVVVHAIGDKANSMVLDVYCDVLRQNGPRDRRWRIEHAQHVIVLDIERYKECGVVASMQPYHIIIDTCWIRNRIGEKRCKDAYIFRSFLDNDVEIAFGSDWTVAPMNPILGIDAAVNRVPAGEEKPWHPEQRISIEEAVRSYTSTPAYSVFDENFYGKIIPGMRADCVVLSQDILTCPKEEIPDTEILATIFDGNIVYEI
ncbi:amidohydrolase [candidate division KSB1 bacterium]